MNQNKCNFCKKVIEDYYFIINDCKHNLCKKCKEEYKDKFEVNKPCVCVYECGGEDILCKSQITNILPVIKSNELINEIYSINVNPDVLEKTKQGVTNFTNNILSSSASIVEESVRDLTYQQKEFGKKNEEIIEKFTGLEKVYLFFFFLFIIIFI
jgi:hypothetical protein